MPTRDPRGVVTQLLHRAADGDGSAWRELLNVVYDELQVMARGHMRAERADHTLQPTALVHEAWLRLQNSESEQPFEDRCRFLAVASRAMRNVLVDHARKRKAAKRGGGAGRAPLDEAVDSYSERGLDLIAIDEALVELESVDPDLLRIVELRFFSGLEATQIAEVVGTSLRSVERGWATARAFLGSRLGSTPN